MREYRIPCGRGGGHGESCCEAQLCDACLEIKRLQFDAIQYRGGPEEVKRLLARWYFSSRREGWEKGEKESDVISHVVDYFANTISGEWPSGWDLDTTLTVIDRGRDVSTVGIDLKGEARDD